MNTTLLMALGLMLVLEGVLPLIAPQSWRETFKRMIEFNNGQLRFIGLFSILGGLLLIYLSR
ncbi:MULTISPECIES: DUF2065 domain-containing protein [Methylotenera]|uniref:DUF2065 domain-containing protein n=1 Tax=Methylotenera TaxID=359407 RepID=UPI00036C57B4|nr:MULTISPECIES: DUF2065 domain-containing protein [Methylotenera]